MKIREGDKFIKPERYELTNDAKAVVEYRTKLRKLFAKSKKEKTRILSADKRAQKEFHKFQHRNMQKWILEVNSSNFKPGIRKRLKKALKTTKPSLFENKRKPSLYNQNTLIIRELGFKPSKTKNKFRSKTVVVKDGLNCKQRRNNKTAGKFRRIRNAG